MATKAINKTARKRLPEEGRNMLLSSAIVLFLERGFNGATAKDISIKAG